MVKQVFRLCVLITVLSSAFALEEFRMTLKGENRIDDYIVRGSMVLEGVASDSRAYRVKLACISKERNFATYEDIGEMYVMNTQSSVGAKAVFDYQECLELYDGLKAHLVEVRLIWDKEGWDKYRSSKLSFEVIEL